MFGQCSRCTTKASVWPIYINRCTHSFFVHLAHFWLAIRRMSGTRQSYLENGKPPNHRTTELPTGWEADGSFRPGELLSAGDASSAASAAQRALRAPLLPATRVLVQNVWAKAAFLAGERRDRVAAKMGVT